MNTDIFTDRKRDEMDRYNDNDDEGKWIADYLSTDGYNNLMDVGHQRLVRETLAKHLTSNASVLSIGAGQGEWLRESTRYEPRHSLALDISVNELRRGSNAENGDRIEWLCGDAERLPVRDDSIDFVLAAAVLHHLPQWKDAILNEICRVLSPDGVFLFFDPLRYNPFAMLARRFLETRKRTEAEVPLNPFTLRSTLESSFETVDLTGFYVISPICTLLDAIAPVNLEGAIHGLSEIERRLSKRGLLPVTAEVVGIASYPR